MMKWRKTEKEKHKGAGGAKGEGKKEKQEEWKREMIRKEQRNEGKISKEGRK
jgi:hypothetical protein